ncbi:putative hydroxymethylpyrimidine transport system ATP-binding protein [Brevinema andersonii]|uniref:Putative hydroxymethylpyrimidine transport system ATP-binding protein n=1 Tax=Brevinema andersonii TaxID=34097 RepID=A0A1I1EAV3_BREAD|nr:ABC transporter ATP-binding protein [Brevinema andersonii]SFB82053.1 putative hydroxymethylpyrimidine transport system ATP-binding protein [Brevinema andersonii]
MIQLFEARNCSVFYDSTLIMKDLNFSISSGEKIALIGHSGCGKSTLLRLMAGIECNARIEGQWYSDLPEISAYIDQNNSLLPWKTVQENVALPMILQGMDKDIINLKVMQVLEEFGLENYWHFFPDELSGGMKQKTILCRALVTDSTILFADEPFASVDMLSRQALVDILKEKFIRKTIIFITHDIQEALRIGDRVLIFAGRPTRQVYNALSREPLLKQRISAFLSKN